MAEQQRQVMLLPLELSGQLSNVAISRRRRPEARTGLRFHRLQVYSVHFLFPLLFFLFYSTASFQKTLLSTDLHILWQACFRAGAERLTRCWAPTLRNHSDSEDVLGISRGYNPSIVRVSLKEGTGGMACCTSIVSRPAWWPRD